MRKNIGTGDRLIRAILGAGLIYYAMSNLPGSDVWMVPAGIVGAIVLLTALVGWCPLYKLLGMNSNGRKTGTFPR